VPIEKQRKIAYPYNVCGMNFHAAASNEHIFDNLPPVPRCAGRVGVFSILAQGRSCCITTAITPADKRTKKRPLQDGLRLMEMHREISTATGSCF